MCGLLRRCVVCDILCEMYVLLWLCVLCVCVVVCVCVCLCVLWFTVVLDDVFVFWVCCVRVFVRVLNMFVCLVRAAWLFVAFCVCVFVHDVS